MNVLVTETIFIRDQPYGNGMRLNFSFIRQFILADFLSSICLALSLSSSRSFSGNGAFAILEARPHQG
jgi:hypothetical protein